MGVHKDTLDFMWQSLRSAGIEKLKNVNMLELGNQIMRQDAKDAYKFTSGYSRVYFLNQRCNHHAVDWNALHGAVPIDMCEPIKEQVKRYVNFFDVITDFGCVEHYGKNQWQGWKNLHDMGRVGSLYIHTVPYIGSVPGHGAYHYDQEFFRRLCERNGYKILHNRMEQHDPRNDRRNYAFCSYVKTSKNKFAPKAEEFEGWLHR